VSWRDNLRPASFRGVPFFIESHEMQGGRRAVQHEYVQREKPFSEDTGRKGREFSFDAYVVGTDYFAARDALISALEKEGAGELVHPYLGQQTVQPMPFRLRETQKDGGMAVFSLTFVEAGAADFPAAVVDNRGVLTDKVEDFLDKVNKAFEAVFSVADKPQFVADQAVKKINGIADKINEAVAFVGKGEQKLAEAQRRIEELRNKAEDFIHTPDKLANAIQNAIQGVVLSAENARDKFNGLKKMFGFGNDDVPVAQTTSTRVQEAKNQDALNTITQSIAVAYASDSAADIPFESTEDAKDVREELIDNFEALEETTTDDDVFQAIQDTKVEVIRGIPAPEEQLPTIGEVELMQSMPSIVVAYDLYQNPDYEQDLINRNKVSHPGFVPGGKSLEVLQVE
jgi:prophage DNA circulation protein